MSTLSDLLFRAESDLDTPFVSVSDCLGVAHLEVPALFTLAAPSSDLSKGSLGFELALRDKLSLALIFAEALVEQYSDPEISLLFERALDENKISQVPV